MEKIKLNCKLHEVKVADVSDRFYSFEGYASTFGNTDLGNDIVERGAFTDSINDLKKNSKPINDTEFSKLMPVLWQHNWDEPIGSFVEMREDARGLYVKGIMPKADDFVKGRVVPQMEAGSISDMSIGFMINEQSYNGDVRSIEKATLYETSLVTIPMNPMAVVTGFKSANFNKELPIAPMETEWDHDGAQDRHTEKGVDDQAYLYAEKTGEDIYEYQLPIADFIDGKLMVIPKAVFRAAFILQSEKGLEGLSDSNVASIKGSVIKYYEAMGMESPFREQKAFKLDDHKSLSERELETLLKGGVCFSQKMTKTIISLLNDEAQRDVAVKSQRDAGLKENLIKLLNTL